MYRVISTKLVRDGSQDRLQFELAPVEGPADQSKPLFTSAFRRVDDGSDPSVVRIQTDLPNGADEYYVSYTPAPVPPA